MSIIAIFIVGWVGFGMYLLHELIVGVGKHCDKITKGNSLMKLQDIMYGHDGFYFCSKNKFYCCVITSHPDDGACLIVERMDELDGGEFDLSGDIRYSEACYLRTPKDLTK